MIALAATAACMLFVAHLFRQEIKSNPASSRALWVPFLWMFLAGSRLASSWLDLSPPQDSMDTYQEGSPIDRAVFFLLIIGGVAILLRRKLAWGRLIACNKLLLLYFAYCLISILWSDAPFVAFKRWFKDMGNPIMVLVILTTPDATKALTQTLRRLSFLFLPLSVLFVKYYPSLGRAYKIQGDPMYTGIGHQKNDLGLMCLVAGVYFLWQLIQDRDHFLTWSRGRRICIYLLSGMLAWLLYMSDSQTSLTCLVIAAAAMLATQLPYVRRQPERLVGLLVVSGLSYFVLDEVFDLKTEVLHLLGRNPTLTNRTELWDILFRIDTDPIFGAGFMSFWVGERMERIWNAVGVSVNQAHSGYIEQFLNLGYVGVSFMVLLLLKALLDARRQLRSNQLMATLRVTFVLAAILYNYTEASFYGISNMWILTLVALIHLPEAPSEAPDETTRRSGPGKRGELMAPAHSSFHRA